MELAILLDLLLVLMGTLPQIVQLLCQLGQLILSQDNPLLLISVLGKFLLGHNTGSHLALVYPCPEPVGHPASGTPCLCIPRSAPGLY